MNDTGTSAPRLDVQPSVAVVQLPKKIRLPHEEYARTERVFHVTFRAAIGERPFLSQSTGEAIWELLLNERSRDSVELAAACLMPDHLHALVSPRGKDIIRWVDGFKSWSTRVAQRTRPQRILWQPGFYDRAIRDEAQFEAALRYVLDNPIAAGLVKERDTWPWVASWVTEGAGVVRAGHWAAGTRVVRAAQWRRIWRVGRAAHWAAVTARGRGGP